MTVLLSVSVSAHSAAIKTLHPFHCVELLNG